MEEEYAKIAEKHTLPSYKDMDLNFEIRDTDKEADILREILRKMYDKVDFYTKFLEDIIQPDARLSTMMESSRFNAQEMQLVNNLHMKGMLITRELMEANLDYSEENASKAISKTFKEWLEIKQGLVMIIHKIKETWKENIKTKDERGYFG